MVNIVTKGQIHEKVQVEKKTAGGPTQVEVTHEETPNTGHIVVPQAHAEVTYSAGITKSLGNFQFARIDVGLKMPCAPDAENVQATYESVVAWVDTRAQQLTDQLP